MMKSSPEVAAILRFKRAGMDIELGRLHDLTCPAYHPEDVAKCHPFATCPGSTWTRSSGRRSRPRAARTWSGPSRLTMAWQAAHVLKGANPAELNDYRLAAHKAFRDANPGPSSAPTPGQISPGKYNRPLITDGHESPSTGHDGPNSSPQVATHGAERALVRPAPAVRRAPVPVPVVHEGQLRVPARDGPPRCSWTTR